MGLGVNYADFEEGNDILGRLRISKWGFWVGMASFVY